MRANTLEVPTPTPYRIVIQPSRGWIHLNLRELWEHRELLYFLVWRDIKVRYKQTVIGIGWAIIQPLFAMVVFSIFFGKLAKIPSEGVPYPAFTLAALVPWGYFSGALSGAANSLVENQRMVTKVYFPRLILPISAVLSGLVDFFISFVVLVGILIFYDVRPTLGLLTVPLFLTLAVATALGVGLWLAALNAIYRDVRYTLPFLIQLWLFATPVAYASSLVPSGWRTLYGLNPMVGVIEGFRWALFEQIPASGSLLLVSGLVVILNLFFGLYFFRRMERTFADVV